MKIHPAPGQTTGQPRVSLEKKIRLLVRKFRTAERRRKRAHKVCCRSEFPGWPARALGLALLLSAALAGTANAAPAAPAAPAFARANAAFAAGNYPAAEAQYEAILAHDGYSAPVLFNLGNACYRAGQLGAAILNFERAQVLAPRDPSIAANLRLARQRAGELPPALNGLQQAARQFSPDALAWAGSAALAAICLTLLARRWFGRFAGGTGILGAAAALLLAAGAGLAVRWPDFNRAIIITPNAPARIAPAGTAAESFALPAGQPVSLGKSYGQFILARTADGRSGWVNADEMGRVFGKL